MKAAIQQAIATIYGETVTDITLQPTKPAFEGLYTFVTFSLTKSLRKSPAELGQAIGQWLVDNTATVSRFNVVQGFLNLSVADSVWTDLIANLRNDTPMPKRGASVMVEFSSPNTNKPLHLGHLRNNFLGESVSRILAANGFDVVRTCIVNDRGIHICKSMLAYQKFGQNADGEWETPDSSGLKGDHLIGK